MKRYTLPLILIVAGVWLLTGCFKVPVPEHADDPSKIDFRKFVGDARSNRPIRPGAITRAQIITRLGPPRFENVDRTAIGYGYTAVRATWVYPLCFGTSPGSDRFYVVRFTFDAADVLRSWKIVYQDGEHDFFIDNTTHWKGDAAGELGLEDAQYAAKLRSTTRPSTRPGDSG